MGQDGPAGVSTWRRSTRGVQDVAVLADKHEIAAPPHHFYNEQESVVLAGGVPLFAVQLEHALQPRLANGADVRVAQVLARNQAEGGVALEPARGQGGNAQYAALLQVSRKQDVGASGLRRKDFHCQAELVREDQLLHPRVSQQW